MTIDLDDLYEIAVFTQEKWEERIRLLCKLLKPCEEEYLKSNPKIKLLTFKERNDLDKMQ